MQKVFVLFVWALLAWPASAAQYFQASDGTVDFSKVAFADPMDPANWDVLSPSVAITRGNTQGIYNPLVDDFYTTVSPAGTLWNFGGTVQDVLDGVLSPGDFRDWVTANNQDPPSTVDVDAVLYLMAEDAYVDLRFTSWGVGGASGGGFAYTRAVVNLVPEPTTGLLALATLAWPLLAARRRS